MTASTQITLLRHGETEGSPGFCGSTDNPLSEKGWAQMHSAVRAVGLSWDRIITSPLARCADFAQVLSTEKRLPLCLDARLQEMHFGDWEGHSAAELMQTDAEALRLFWENPTLHTPPAAEALLDFQTRVMKAWHDLLENYRGERLLVVSHGGVIRSILCHVQQHPIERLLELPAAHASLHQVEVSVGADGQAVYTKTAARK